MQITHGNHLSIAFGSFAKRPTIGKLECQLGAVPGAFMRIVEPPGVKLWRVTVALGTESSGTLERAFAWRNPMTRDWEYVRKTRGLLDGRRFHSPEPRITPMNTAQRFLNHGSHRFSRISSLIRVSPCHPWFKTTLPSSPHCALRVHRWCEPPHAGCYPRARD
jgi:hypothetical protein